MGRVARAGSSGTAYSFVALDEVPYVLDLHLFLGRSLKLSTKCDEGGVQDGLLGSVPQRIIDEEEEYIRHVLETSPDLVSVYRGPHIVLDCALMCTYIHTYIHTYIIYIHTYASMCVLCLESGTVQNSRIHLKRFMYTC